MFTGKETGIDPGGRGNPHMISRDLVDQFGALLRDHEKSNATIEKYTRDVRTFIAWLDEADAAEAADYAHKFLDVHDVDVTDAVDNAEDGSEILDSKVTSVRVDHGLFAIAATHYNNGEFAEAAKVFRAGAEFAGDGLAQYYLAMLYDAGSGGEQSDLAALYWLDRAVDSGSADMALEYRDGILDAYRQSLPEGEFRQVIKRLAAWCDQSTADIPADPDKAQRWREISQGCSQTG